MFFLGNILNYFRSSVQRMNIHPTCSVQGNNLGRPFISAHSWILNTNWGVPSLKHIIHLWKISQDWWSMSPFPCLCSYPGPYCYPISPNSDLFCRVSRMVGWAWERERTPEARCSQDHREQAAREDDVSSLSEWLTWVGQLKETARGSPSAESALSFPGSLN